MPIRMPLLKNVAIQSRTHRSASQSQVLSGTAMASAANAFFTALGLAAQQNDAYYGAN